jgi:hypothetical protein
LPEKLWRIADSCLTWGSNYPAGVVALYRQRAADALFPEDFCPIRICFTQFSDPKTS